MYDAVSCGVVQVDRLRRALAGLALPRDRGGRIVLAVDVSAWLRPDAATAPPGVTAAQVREVVQRLRQGGRCVMVTRGSWSCSTPAMT